MEKSNVISEIENKSETKNGNIPESNDKRLLHAS